MTLDDLSEIGVTWEMKLGAYIAQRAKQKVRRHEIPLNYAGHKEPSPQDVMAKDLGFRFL